MKESIQSLVIIYFLTINVATFFTYGIDKLKAKKNMWRISEPSLLLPALLGGSIGALLGMKIWHHKTMHKKFKYGIPAIILIQVLIIGYILIK